MTAADIVQNLKEAGVDIISSQRDTIIQVKIKGLAGKRLMEALRQADRAIAQKVSTLIEIANKENSGSFVDPVFGPTDEDEGGAFAMCKLGTVIIRLGLVVLYFDADPTAHSSIWRFSAPAKDFKADQGGKDSMGETALCRRWSD